MLYNEDFKKESFKDVIKFKIKWVLRVLNYPFKKLENWM